MAFGLKSLFRGVKNVVKKVGGSFLGSLLGGPLGVGAAVGAQIGEALAPTPRAIQPFVGTQAGPQAGGPFMPLAVGGAGLGGLGTIPRAGQIMRRFGGEMAVLGGTALILSQARENTGRRVTAKQIIEAARVCGLQVAADTFGLDVTQVCELIVTRRRRRARGISAADLRRTRSTIRKVANIRKELKALAR